MREVYPVPHHCSFMMIKVQINERTTGEAK